MHHFRQFLPTTILVFVFTALAWTAVMAQQEKPIPQRLSFIIVGTRPEVTFEKRGDLYIEVDAPVHTIPPTQINILEGKQDGESSDAVLATLPASLNEVVHHDDYQGGRSLRLALKRPIVANGAAADIEVTCDVGESPAPLIVIFPENPSRGWESPVVRVFDVSAATLPANAVLCVNLSRATLGARIGTSSGAIAAGQNKVFALSAENAATIPFRVDLLISQGSIPLANTNYSKPSDSALVLLAFPLARVGPGNPPIALQFVPLPPMAAPKP